MKDVQKGCAWAQARKGGSRDGVGRGRGRRKRGRGGTHQLPVGSPKGIRDDCSGFGVEPAIRLIW